MTIFDRKSRYAFSKSRWWSSLCSTLSGINSPMRNF
eukprot:CAMPEP_0176325976 /NCGR_PEP_ID=MMETSP0121_2-20121125/73691_1 /TAXON_ID=160619 /ORGANISM="Kryptoperidinium foliaceum, Strain CCMP 1326" /LENGTH=35 /DNA_ID= /DNA_START= /DNA_END= /DNA_ORIENTATION=